METSFHVIKSPLLSILGWIALLLFSYMSLWSLVAIAKKRADLADIAWGPGFILVAWASLILNGCTFHGIILNALVTIWGVRLAIHLFMRNRNREEDFRYQALKLSWGQYFHFKMFTKVFILQGVILYVVALPIVWIHTHPELIPEVVLFFSFGLWLIGFLFETIADLQLALFKQNGSNRGQLLTTGLWGYVRHPNYLGELIQWWAIWLAAAFLPFGWALVISPLLLTFLIVKVSGVKPLEEKFKHHPEFQTYLEKTPSLIPLPLVNGLLYGLTWFVFVAYGHKNPIFISLFFGLSCYTAQLFLFAKWDRTSLRVAFPLSMIALALGLVQELLLMYFKIVSYPENPIFPPFQILTLYPLFSLTLNSSLAFLNKNLILTFFLGGVGGLFSYLSGERLGQVQLFGGISYLLLFLFWALFLTVLILINRKLFALLVRN